MRACVYQKSSHPAWLPDTLLENNQVPFLLYQIKMSRENHHWDEVTLYTVKRI